MIDICGFSKWCVSRVPNKIVTTMNTYNEFLIEMVGTFPELTKIELVGDCCMVVGGMIQNMDRPACTRAVIHFAINLLDNLQMIRDIFDDKYIGIRIGVHMADVFGVMLKNPRRFQLYSTDINVCSRLESCAIRNTIHISLKTVLENEYLLSEEYMQFYTPSPLNENEYKGVGHVASYTLHIRRNELLWFGTTLCFLKRRIIEYKSILEHVCAERHTTFVQQDV